MLTSEPNEAVETAMKIKAANDDDGGANPDAHIDGFMSGVEAVVARPDVDRSGYLGQVAEALEGKADEDGSGFLGRLADRLRRAQRADP